MCTKRKFLSLSDKIKILDIYEAEKLSCNNQQEKLKAELGVEKS